MHKVEHPQRELTSPPNSFMGPRNHAGKSDVSFKQHISVMEEVILLNRKNILDILFQKQQATPLPSTPREN